MRESSSTTESSRAEARESTPTHTHLALQVGKSVVGEKRLTAQVERHPFDHVVVSLKVGIANVTALEVHLQRLHRRRRRAHHVLVGSWQRRGALRQHLRENTVYTRSDGSVHPQHAKAVL